MDFLKKAMESETSNDESQKPSPQPHESHNTSTTELMSSAKVLAGAAQSSFRHESVDKSKVADAADDVLDGASKYGKLEEKGYGQYVEKADSYIHKYKSGQSPAPPSANAEHPAPTESSEGGKSEGGFGDVMKMAQGFLK